MKPTRPMFCLIQDDFRRCGEFTCPCGWPAKPCIQMHAFLRHDIKPVTTWTDGKEWRLLEQSFATLTEREQANDNDQHDIGSAVN